MKDKCRLFKTERIENIVIGSGAAGFQAALRLFQSWEKELALVENELHSTDNQRDYNN